MPNEVSLAFVSAPLLSFCRNRTPRSMASHSCRAVLASRSRLAENAINTWIEGSHRSTFFKASHSVRFSNTSYTVRRFSSESASIRAEAVAGSDAAVTKTEGRKNVLDIKEASKGAEQSKLELNPPRGTRDWYPEDMRLRNWLFGNFREVARIYGFEEWDAPVLEHEDLYVRKAGEEITTQLYNFEDKGNRKVTLRPELTPSLARMVLAKGKSLSLPVKWSSVGQCWRYERMTRGRKREHYQWNMDIWGVEGVEAEAELLAAIVAFFQRVGLSSKDVGLRISNRKVLQAILDQLQVPKDRFASVCVLVDKLEKMPREAIADELAALGLDDSLADRLISALKMKSLSELATLVGEDSDALKELRHLFSLAEHYGISDWLVFDASIVRGLAYYTGVVFEGFDRGASLRAICGGGRYDRLLSSFGGSDIPACGFGFGDVVIVELLKDKGLLPDLKQKVDDYVFAFDAELRGPALKVASKLRSLGRSVEVTLENKKVKWAFKQAERVGASRMILIGSNEWAKGVVKAKDLVTGQETELAFEDI